jgi:hypothetical protein
LISRVLSDRKEAKRTAPRRRGSLVGPREVPGDHGVYEGLHVFGRHGDREAQGAEPQRQPGLRPLLPRQGDARQQLDGASAARQAARLLRELGGEERQGVEHGITPPAAGGGAPQERTSGRPRPLPVGGAVDEEVGLSPRLGGRLARRVQERLGLLYVALRDFRTEVRTAYQLVTLYRDIRARHAEAVISRYVEPPDLWPHADPSPVDQHLSVRLEAACKKYRVGRNQAGKRRLADLAATSGVNVEAMCLHDGLDVLIHCVNRRLWNVRPWVEWNFWDAPPGVSASLGLERWFICPDLLTAMYLEVYLLVTDKKPMRICANPNCRMPFPAVPKHKKFCRGGCRSTGRNHPH